MKRFLTLLPFVVLLSGCASFEADEVHRTMSYPLIGSDTIAAIGIKKEVAPDGTVTRHAESVTHETNIMGFTRTVVYKNVTIQTKKD